MPVLLVKGAGRMELTYQSAQLPWFALRVRPRYEKSIAAALTQIGMPHLLPLQRARHRWSQRWKIVDMPLFPGYLFASFDRKDWSQLMNIPGVMDAVRFGKMLAEVDRDEIASLRIAANAQCDLEGTEYLASGQKIRLVQGPLAGLEGIILDDQGKAELILSVTLLQRSVRTRVEREWLETHARQTFVPVQPELVAAVQS